MKQGLFIAVDGGEGSYKSGVISAINDEMRKLGVETILTREPGGTPIAEKLRAMLLQCSEEKINENTELLMMYAARSQHVECVIKPALQEKKCVISDRFSSSTIAYQCFGRGISREKVNDIERIVLNGFCPDLTIIMDLDPAIGLARARNRAVLDRIEQENMDFFKRVREGYLHQTREFPERFSVVDASGTFENSRNQVLERLSTFLESKGYK